MAKIKNTEGMKRIEIPYFNGVNCLVADNLSKKEELNFAQNCRSVMIGSIEKRAGYSRLGSVLTVTANYGLFFFENDVAAVKGIYRISTVSAITKIYYLNASAVWVALTGTYTAVNFSNTIAEECAFLVNGSDNNMYIKGTDGTTIVDSTTVAGHLYNSPKAKKINYYKEKLYLADYTDDGGTRYRNGVMMSSPTLGIISLIDGDHGQDECEIDDWIKVTDTKYLRSTDTIDIYRGGIKIAEVGIKDKNEDSFQIKTITFEETSSSASPSASMSPSSSISASISPSSSVSPSLSVSPSASGSSSISPSSSISASTSPSSSLSPSASVSPSPPEGIYYSFNSADEVWVHGSYEGTRYFRWADSPKSGIDVARYDTFKVSGGQNDRIKMMTNIGDVMIISNNFNMAIWNGSSLKNLDNGIGCVSDRGFVKAFDTLFFLGYKGIYQTNNGMPALISSKVQPYIDGASRTNLEKGAIGVKGTSIFCSIGDVDLFNADGSDDQTLNDVVLEKNLKTQNWYIHTGITATQFATYVESSNVDRLIYSSTDTNYPLFEFLTGTLDDEGGDNKEIYFRADTGNITLSKEFEKFCYPQKIILEIERGANMTCFISLDNDPFYELSGSIIKGCSVINITGKDENVSSPPRCRKINISIRDYSKQICKISKIAIIYKLTAEEVQEDLN